MQQLGGTLKRNTVTTPIRSSTRLVDPFVMRIDDVQYAHDQTRPAELRRRFVGLKYFYTHTAAADLVYCNYVFAAKHNYFRYYFRYFTKYVPTNITVNLLWY